MPQRARFFNPSTVPWGRTLLPSPFAYSVVAGGGGAPGTAGGGGGGGGGCGSATGTIAGTGGAGAGSDAPWLSANCASDWEAACSDATSAGSPRMVGKPALEIAA